MPRLAAVCPIPAWWLTDARRRLRSELGSVTGVADVPGGEDSPGTGPQRESGRQRLPRCRSAPVPVVALHPPSVVGALVVSAPRGRRSGRGPGQRRRLSVRVCAVSGGARRGDRADVGMGAGDVRMAHVPALRARRNHGRSHVRDGLSSGQGSASRHDRTAAWRHRHERDRQFLHRGLRVDPLRCVGNRGVHRRVDAAVPGA